MYFCGKKGGGRNEKDRPSVPEDRPSVLRQMTPEAFRRFSRVSQSITRGV